jgi:hypothetical protein
MATARRGRGSKDGAQDPIVENVIERIRVARNFDFRNYKRGALQRRLERRMTTRNCASLPEYLSILEREPAEFDALIASLLIKVTEFFRDREMWDSLSRNVIPRLLAEKAPGETSASGARAAPPARRLFPSPSSWPRRSVLRSNRATR